MTIFRKEHKNVPKTSSITPDEPEMEYGMDYQQAEAYILEIPKFSGKNSYSDTEAFYRYLKSPGERQRIVHVAGTNGKGSVCAYLEGILQEGGYSVGMFTSPHLIFVRERFRINQVMVSEESFLRAFLHIQKGVHLFCVQEEKQYHPSFFEFLFFMGMYLFEEAGCEYIVLETGLGGRLDATNVITSPALCIITKIGLDHMEYLGESKQEIAKEKAGIIKENRPVITIDYEEEISEVIRKQAKEKHTNANFVEKPQIENYNFENKTIAFSCKSVYYGYVTLQVGTTALYQTENIALAMNAAHIVDDKHRLTIDVIQSAVAKTVWEGRMEEVEPGVFVDGAHNVDGVEAFLDSVRYTKKENLHLLFSAVSDKAYEKMLFMLLEDDLFEEVAVTQIDGVRAVPYEKLREMAVNIRGKQVFAYANVTEALEACLQRKRKEDILYIVGSLYLVGMVKEILAKKQ